MLNRLLTENADKVFIFLFSLLAGSCAASKAPSDWLSSPHKAQEESYGGWLYIEYFETDRESLKDTVILSPRVGAEIDSTEGKYFSVFRQFDGFYRAVVFRTLSGKYFANITCETSYGDTRDTIVECSESFLINIAEKIDHYEELEQGKYRYGDQLGQLQIHKPRSILSQLGKWKSKTTLKGEFIALQDQLICILTQNDSVVFIPVFSIYYAVLETHEHKYGPLALWTLIGTLSTISHGFFLIITAPVWLISGTISTVNASYEGYFTKKHPDIEWWKSVERYARFPQGLPGGVNINSIKPKK